MGQDATSSIEINAIPVCLSPGGALVCVLAVSPAGQHKHFKFQIQYIFTQSHAHSLLHVFINNLEGKLFSAVPKQTHNLFTA